MTLIDVSELTINAEEAHEVSKLIIEKAFVQGALSEVHDIETGIFYKEQIPFAGRIEDSLKKAVGCTPETGEGLTLTEKFWDPEIFASRWEHCAADLNKLLKLFKHAAKINPDFYDQIDSEALGVVYALIEQMMNDTLPIKVWFSDRDAEFFADGGEFKAGTDLDLYNVIDGLFKQIFAEIATGDANYVNITQNAGANYAAQALPADAALGYLTSVVNAADSRLLEDPRAQILVTRSIADNFRNTLRTKTLGAGFLEVVENGKPQLYFDGYKVVVMHEWDRFIGAVQNNAVKKFLPHRIVFTTPSNIPVGTVSEEDLKTLTSFYDQYRKSNVIDVAFSLDTKFLENYMAVAAY